MMCLICYVKELLLLLHLRMVVPSVYNNIYTYTLYIYAYTYILCLSLSLCTYLYMCIYIYIYIYTYVPFPVFPVFPFCRFGTALVLLRFPLPVLPFYYVFPFYYVSPFYYICPFCRSIMLSRFSQNTVSKMFFYALRAVPFLVVHANRMHEPALLYIYIYIYIYIVASRGTLCSIESVGFASAEYSHCREGAAAIRHGGEEPGRER